MNTSHPARRSQGSVLIEFTLVVVMLLAMMSATWSIGNFMLQESLLRAAVEDAAQAVANTSPLEMLDADAADEVLDRAADRLEDTVDATGNTRESVDVECRPAACTAATGPTRIRVRAVVNISDTVFAYFGFDGRTLIIVSEVPYGGRSPAQ